MVLTLADGATSLSGFAAISAMDAERGEVHARMLQTGNTGPAGSQGTRAECAPSTSGEVPVRTLSTDISAE
jgi:hypothetical protein